jgi:hypothetical protein
MRARMTQRPAPRRESDIAPLVLIESGADLLPQLTEAHISRLLRSGAAFRGGAVVSWPRPARSRQ